MSLIAKIRTIWYRWRQQVSHRQYEKGWNDAHTIYLSGGWSLDELEILTRPVGDQPLTPFEHGVRDAVSHLRNHLDPTNTTGEIETNDNGDPVGVPYFIHQGNFHPPMCPYCEGAGVIYEGGMSMNPEIDNEVPCSRCSSNSGE